jgi:hypothetical protein
MQMAGNIWVALLLGVTVVALVVGSAANRRVMSKHPEIWSQLGKPEVFNNSISNSLKSLKFFVLTSDYKRLEDDTLNRYVGISRSLNFMMMFLLVVGAICMVTGKFGLADAAAGPEDRGENFFSKNERELIEIAKLVSQCAGDGVLSIYPDGHVLRSVDGTVRCPSTKISTRMRPLGVLWVNASGDRPYGQHGPFATTFVLSSRGIIGAGHGSAIYYFPNPERYPFKDSVALKGVPGHWFFRQY